MKKLFELFGSLITLARKDNSATEGYAPYANKECNRLYNWLFCDKLAVMRRETNEPPQDVWATLLAEQPYAAGIKAIADNAAGDSRARAVAFNRLRDIEQTVPVGLLLGVVVEVALPDGLDVLAAYPDGRVHYIHHKETASNFDRAPQTWLPTVRRLMNASQDAVERIGPWQQLRLAPPTVGMIRMSFLVSDGLYFGQGPMAVMEKDELAGPIIAAGGALLKQILAADVRSE